MKIKIKRVDKSLPLPEYHTEGSTAFDVYSRIDMIIPAKTVDRIPTNIIIETPKGYMAQIKGRSSTPKKKNLWVDVGYIDQDYCGETDEILLQVLNFTNEDVRVEKGERLGQIAFVRVDTVEFEEVEKMNDESRGGFGSTG
ncbi:MAG: dUTP diphosphatase [Candidatus Magasanikbacteria bacterium]